jgi:hypothetical protein
MPGEFRLCYDGVAGEFATIVAGYTEFLSTIPETVASPSA